ncbi:MAG TPA: hypothetical protein H9733_07875 [Candidatus Anaerotignum merdipullorum]|nr:hypothetical protein [Candidatus Anaerotignum merdipullorum]
MFVKRLRDDQIAEIMQVISDSETEVTDIRRPYTDPEVTVLSQGMEEHYVLHDYDIEGFDYLPEGSTYLYRKKMLEFFGIVYATRYLLRK